jgi:hypothetical protein
MLQGKLTQQEKGGDKAIDDSGHKQPDSQAQFLA